MKPDFWLCQTGRDRFVLTPCSALGRIAQPGLSFGKDIGSGLVLTQDECSFITQVLEDSYYVVKRLNRVTTTSSKPSAVKVVDTRPKPSRARYAPPSRIFPWARGSEETLSSKARTIVDFYKNYRSKGKPRPYEIPSHLLRLTSYDH